VDGIRHASYQVQWIRARGNVKFKDLGHDMQTPVEQPEFVPVADTMALGDWIERSHEEPVVLFLHDPWCPISGRANGEMRRVNYTPIALVDVSRQRDVSQEVERTTGVRHESPQVIVLRDGKPLWDASHFAITADAVERILGVEKS
jgi:bacillithiol system protein YtxJ